MKNNFFLLLAFLLLSCDPVDERLIFINENEEKHIQLMYFSDGDFESYIRGKSPHIVYKGTNNFPILGSWRGYAKNDDFMILRIYDKNEFEELDSIYNGVYGKGNYNDTQIADTLVSKNKFVDKKIYFKELKKNEWVIKLD
jgi:hypothetical protein